MVKIIGISGKKQSGKNTAANYIHGIILKSKNIIEDFEVNKQGQLIIKTAVDGDEEYGVLDITRKDNNFVEYAHHNLWPYVKLYSFADGLKNLCIQFFGLSFAQTYGTDVEKNTLSKIKWEDTPTWQNSSLNTNRGLMTSRELLQYFGTDIMRQMYTNIWVDHAINTIEREQSELAILADVRFPNEVEAVKKAGGKVIRLTRECKNDEHSSECALDEDRYDWKNFDFIVDNTDGLKDFFSQIENISNKLEFTC
jgi:hypothetical protein